MVLPTNHDVPAGFASGQLTIQNGGRSILGAAAILVAFALVFAIGGWSAIGNPPKPFASAEGFFVSGIQVQTTAMLGLFFLIVAVGKKARMFIDDGLALIWRLASASAVLAMAIIFLWASARFLFGLSAFPSQAAPVSFSETWWIELALALFGLALTGSIPVLLRQGGHVCIDVLATRTSTATRAHIFRWGTLVLAVPFGWVLLTKGTIFAARSWNQWEGSQNFGIEFVFLVKTLVPLLGFLILVVSALCLRHPVRAVSQ